MANLHPTDALFHRFDLHSSRFLTRLQIKRSNVVSAAQHHGRSRLKVKDGRKHQAITTVVFLFHSQNDARRAEEQASGTFSNANRSLSQNLHIRSDLQEDQKKKINLKPPFLSLYWED